MIGGFYNKTNLYECGWREEELKENTIPRSNNYCKDINGDVILNIYKPNLNELLEKMKADIDKHETEKEAFLKKIKEDITKLEPAKKTVLGHVCGHHDIFDVFNIYQYNIIISKETTLEATKQKKIKEKLQIANHVVIDELLESAVLSDFLKQNSRDLKYYADKIKNIEPLKKQVPVLEAFIRKYYKDVTGEWSKNCIDKDELDKILQNVPNNKYMEELVKYFNRTNLKPYIEDYKCLNIHNNIYENLFEYIVGENFKIYNKERGSDDSEDIYYELYTHTANRDSLIYNNYLLEEYLYLGNKTPTTEIRPTDMIVTKCVLYPNYVEDNYDYNLNKLSFIIYNSENILKKLIFALKINTVNKIDVFLDRYIRNNQTNSIIYHNHYTLLDVFIISNLYHIYYEMLDVRLDFNIHIYNDEYLQKNIDNKFEGDEFIEYIKKQINTNSKINSSKYKDEISNFDKIRDTLLEEGSNLLIMIYNYLFLSNKNISEFNILALEKINRHLKYTNEQILNLICLDLYKEILENYCLCKFYYINHNIKILLNVFYYNSIYKLDKIKNIINYCSQFQYLKKYNEHYDIDDKYNKYNKYSNYDVYISNEGVSSHRNFYYSLFNSADIKYVPFNYKNFRMTLLHYKSKEDFRVIENVSACGEILIFNIINLLIYDGNDINPAYLPETTIPELKKFYENKKLSDFENRDIVLKYFIPLLHNIEFVSIGGVAVYSYHYIDGNKIMKGTEIQPTYLNVCRILAYLFGLVINDGTKITCEYDILITIFRLFSGNIKDILLKNFAFPKDYKFESDTFLFLYFGSFELYFADNHSEMTKAGTVLPNNYITFFSKEALYEQIIIRDEKHIFSLLVNQDEKNIEEIIQIIYSNNFYGPLFKEDKYLNEIRIINNITDFAKLGKIIKIMGYANIEAMINQYMSDSHSHFRNLQLLSKIFTSFYGNIDYGKINIHILEESLISNEMPIFPFLVNQIIEVASSQKVLLDFLLTMKPASIDIIFNNRLKYMIQEGQYDIGEILQYMKLFKPNNYDINILCDCIKVSEFFIIMYLSTGVSREKQILMYNKLYFDEEKIDGVLKIIDNFANTYTYEKNEKNDGIIDILNQSLNILLGLLMIKDIEDEKILDRIIQIIIGYFINIQKLVLTKELFEDKYYYCLFKSFIYYNNKFINNKIKYKLEYQEDIIERFIHLINIIDPFTYENITYIFSSEIGRELFEVFKLHIDHTGISYKKANGEVQHIGFKISAHQAKYLKYKSKYLQLKQNIF